MGTDYYNVLNITKDANEDDLKKAYKLLAMKWHPDKNITNKLYSEFRFKQINQAYDVLSDKEKRRIYDQFGEEGLVNGAGSGGGQKVEKKENKVAKEDKKGKGFKFSARDAEEIFVEVCGGGEEGKGKGKETVESKLGCKLEEIYFGTRKKMKIARKVLDVYGKLKTVEEILIIDVKPGWKKGTKITFPGKGNYGGDIVFVIDEKPHVVFKRDGNDLVMNQRISLLEALTGKILQVTTLDGRVVTVKIKDVVKPGDELIVPDEGMPNSKEPGTKGNLRIKFDVKFPSSLSPEQKFGLKNLLGGSL